jgi:inosine/xanthosine triphosphate pyrophosphatase family protein
MFPEEIEVNFDVTKRGKLKKPKEITQPPLFDMDIVEQPQPNLQIVEETGKDTAENRQNISNILGNMPSIAPEDPKQDDYQA